MLKGKKDAKKDISININISMVIVLATIMLFLGIYIYNNFSSKDVIAIETTAIDNYGYLKNEQIELEAKKIENDLYEVQLPQNINTKEVNKITNVTLESKNETQEKIDLEVAENKIKLTKEQMENYKINIDVEYDVVLKQKKEDGTFETINLAEKTEEEIKRLEISDDTEILYEKTLKHEEQDNDSLIQLEGKLPEETEMHVEELSRDKIEEIFGETPIASAYDIKILKNGTTQINPKDFDEICEVSIQASNIAKNSQVYHVKEDNTYEQVKITENIEGKVSFEAQSFSVYAVGSDELEPDPGTETGTYGDITVKITGLENGASTTIGPTTSCNEEVTVYAQYSPTISATGISGNGLCWNLINSSGTQEYLFNRENSSFISKCNDLKRTHTSKTATWSINASGTWIVTSYIYQNQHTNSGNLIIKINYVTEDTTPPTISVNPSSCDWRNSAINTTITVADTGGSGLSSDNSYQYYLSKSQTALSGGSWQNYTSGTAISLNPENTGAYYLFVNVVKDGKGNTSSANGTLISVSGVNYLRFGPYQFDYTAPTVGTMTMKLRKLKWK